MLSISAAASAVACSTVFCPFITELFIAWVTVLVRLTSTHFGVRGVTLVFCMVVANAAISLSLAYSPPPTRSGIDREEAEAAGEGPARSSC